MTDVLTRGSRQTVGAEFSEPTLHVRGPAYSVVLECLRIQSSARKQSGLARFMGEDPIRTDARSWYQGALGEIGIAKALKKLPPGWTVLHAVPVDSGDSDIDHVVIGPGGIFTITTKNHSGQRVWLSGDLLLVNGHRTHHLADATFEANRAARLLSSGAGEPVEVTPIIAIVDPGSLIVKAASANVLVVTSRQLARTLTRRERVLSDVAVASITRAATERGTWHADEHVVDDTLHHEARFTRLRQHVNAARRRRAVWLLSTPVAATMVVIGLVANSSMAAFGY